ncbi:MAG: metal ABC transporter permease [Pseudomonadota bacterium]
MEFLSALSEFRFLQHAVLACVLASIGCGVIGSFIVVKRISFLTGGIAHSVLAGMGAAYFYSASPLIGAIVAAVISGLLIGWIHLQHKEQEDVLIAAFWSCGMAIGILFLSVTPGYNVDLMSYLFGNVLLISVNDLIMMLVLDILIIGICFIFYKQLLASVFDEEFARLRGINTHFYYLLLLCLISLSVVLLIQLVGVIMVIALLTLPAAIANQYTRSLHKMFVIAALICLVLSLSGLMISFEPDLPAGSVIVLLTCISYFLSLFFRKKAYT